MDPEIFKEEAYELLDETEETLLALKDAPADMELVNRLFRAFHTIKGSGAMFGFQGIADFTHQVESAIDVVRQRELTVSEDFLDIILAARDHILKMLDAPATDDKAIRQESQGIITRLTGFSEDKRPTGLSPEYLLDAVFPPDNDFPRLLDEVYELLRQIKEAAARLPGEPDHQDPLLTRLDRALRFLVDASDRIGCQPVTELGRRLQNAVKAVRQQAGPVPEAMAAVMLVVQEHLFLMFKSLEAHGKIPGTEAEKVPRLTDELQQALAGLEGPLTEETATKQRTGPAPEIDLEIPAEQLLPPETFAQFVREGDALLLKMEEDLRQWSREPRDLTLVPELFGTIRNFKGNCGFVGLKELERLSRAMESVLQEVKASRPPAPDKIIETFLSLTDLLKSGLAALRRQARPEIPDIDRLLGLLRNLTAARNDGPPEILAERPAAAPDDAEKASETRQGPANEPPLAADAARQAPKKREDLDQGRPQAKPGSKRQDIRVDLNKLDSLVNLIGEMVIAENMLIHNPDLAGLELENFNKAAQHMSKIVRELQEMAMIIRMLPLTDLFRRMNRLAHDLSRKSGKKVDFRTAGANTEVDKTVIEVITDPLIHLIRNALDHGLEDTEARLAAGKAEAGTINLTATHEEGDVVLTITDDGQGLDRDKILAKAEEKGVVSGNFSQMTNQEVFQLIFRPGFSTARTVTDISGRGVGLDVVKKNLEKIKGVVEIKSRPGLGTTFILRIPLTMAIIDGMLVRTGNTRYILPLLSIRESFQCRPNAVTVTPDGQELVRVRENLLPVVRLHDLHNIRPDHHELENGILIVLETRDTACLFVDEILGQQQTVIKSLSRYIGRLGDVGGVSGCTILGNGEICLILDVASLSDPGVKRAATFPPRAGSRSKTLSGNTQGGRKHGGEPGFV